jgi:hypothetical protein
MSNNFKTPKGTSLPLLDLKGKDYLQVMHRIVWFREEHADWAIETSVTLLGEDQAACLSKATIKDATGKIIATSHKVETAQGFPDFIEKAETGSIGRALALCGYGTQFVGSELDEGARIVDSPAPKAYSKTPSPKVTPKANTTVPFSERKLGLNGEMGKESDFDMFGK